jgi:hypothetical protein
MAATTLRWNNGIVFSCVPCKLCEGAFPQVHLAVLSLALFAHKIRHKGHLMQVLAENIYHQQYHHHKVGNNSSYKLGLIMPSSLMTMGSG